MLVFNSDNARLNYACPGIYSIFRHGFNSGNQSLRLQAAVAMRGVHPQDQLLTMRNVFASRNDQIWNHLCDLNVVLIKPCKMKMKIGDGPIPVFTEKLQTLDT